jgi:hypothetical protein
MQNPFESGQIKNYLALYAGVVVIMILFFMASTLFNENEDIDKKVFHTTTVKTQNLEEKVTQETNVSAPRFKLLDKAY